METENEATTETEPIKEVEPTEAPTPTVASEEHGPTETPTPTEIPAVEEPEDDIEALRESFNSKLGETKPLWYDSVRNDVTGNWHELVVYSDKAMDKDLVIDYANAYISSEKEIHFVINL